MTLRRLFCLLLAALLLTGCAAPKEAAFPQEAPLASSLPTVPPVPGDAPVGDAGLSYEAAAVLYLPSADGQQLLSDYRTLTFTYSLHPAETILRALLSHEGGGWLQAVSPVPLRLAGSDPVEVAGGVATVNLSAEALNLPREELHTVCRAITATLCELPDVSYVNVLAAGRPLAMDEAGYLPLGSLTAQPGQELPVLWEQLLARRIPEGTLPTAAPLTAAATLYFPLEDGSGIVPETRRITFAGQHPQQLVLGLLAALSSGPEQRQGASELPELTLLLAAAPEITTLSDGTLRVTLRFTENLRGWLDATGADPACAFASLVYTLSTFVPGLRQVCLATGDRAVTSAVREGFDSRLFPGGIHTREDYTGYLRAQTSVFSAEEGMLIPVTAALPYRSIRSPRALLLALPALGEEGGVLPAPMTDADVLGLCVMEDTLFINLSDRYAAVLREQPESQRLAAYAIVNTMCEGLGVRRVRFFFGSAVEDSLGGSLMWSGDFLFTPGLIR